MRSRTIGFALILFLGLPILASGPAGVPGLGAQESTSARVIIRVVSRDAKLIGSAVGGARITVRDAETGSVLAEGVQEGSTGDTRRIVTEPRERGADI